MELEYPIKVPASVNLLARLAPEQVDQWAKERHKERGWSHFIAALSAPDCPLKVHEYIRPMVEAWQAERVYIAIVGSRNYQQHGEVALAVLSLQKYLGEYGYIPVILSGGARGVDTVAVKAAQRLGLEYMEFIPDWEKYGKGAGFRRNAQIIRHSHATIAFYDGKSRGTANSIQKTREMGHECLVFEEIYNCEPNIRVFVYNWLIPALKLEQRAPIGKTAPKRPVTDNEINDMFFN